MEAAQWTAIGILAGGLFYAIFALGARIDAMSGRIDALGSDLGSRIENLRFDLGGRIDRLDTRLRDVEREIFRPDRPPRRAG